MRPAAITTLIPAHPPPPPPPPAQPNPRITTRYRKVLPRTHDATLVHESGEHRLERGEAVSELATFGVYLAASQEKVAAPLVNR